MIDHEQIIHILKSTLLAIVATLLLSHHQIRNTFHETREAYVSHQRGENRKRNLEHERKQQLKQEKRQQSTSSTGKTTAKKAKSQKSSAKYQNNNNDNNNNNNENDNKNNKNIINEDDGTFVIAFFHPHPSSSGGGERVLWKSIQALGEMKGGRLLNRRTKTKKGTLPGNLDDVRDAILENCRNVSVVVYTVEEPTKGYDERVLGRVRERFGIVISKGLKVTFVHLHEVKHLLDKPKRLTLLAESWGTIKLAWYALNVVTPHVYVDTTGCAFTFLVAKILAGCKVATYVHYPTISTDMLSLVWERRPSYNNDVEISANRLVTYGKLVYYAAFAMMYGMVGSLSDLTMVNSTWTKGHISRLWRMAGRIHVVFPPVDTKGLGGSTTTTTAAAADDDDDEGGGREKMILSIGQFRPEKDHGLQLRSFAKFLSLRDGAMRRSGAKLVLIGSCRNDDDRERVTELETLADELGVRDDVTFVLNEPHPVLRGYLRRASVGVHTMWNEHFGIGVVEMMAAGLVVVAHDSGGPKSDIILIPWDFEEEVEEGDSSLPSDSAKSANSTDCTGCLASTADGYAAAFYQVFSRDEEGESEVIEQIRENGRKSAERFSDEVFMDSFKETILPLFKNRPRLKLRWQK